MAEPEDRAGEKGTGGMNIPLCRPYMDQEIKDQVLRVLDSGWLSEGEHTRELERLVAEHAGAAHAVAVTSCTAGLEVALRCLGIGPGDEVLVPDFTYPATALTVHLVGAAPVLVDVDRSSMLIDLDAAHRAVSPRTKAMMPVSLFGNPLDYDALGRFKEEHGLYMVEDAACALGAAHGGRPAGSWADISVFSFHPRKNITTGEGGMIVTQNQDWERWMRAYAHYGAQAWAGKARHRASFVGLGTNLKLSNLAAAVGVAQMKRAHALRRRREELALGYCELLQGVESITLPQTTPGGIHAWQTFCVMVPRRDQVMEHMWRQGIEVQIGTYALHLQPVFGQDRKEPDPPAASRWVYDHGLALPLYHDLTAEQQQAVAAALAEALEKAA